MKKTLSILLAISLLFCLASCSKEKNEEKRSKDVQTCENNIKSIKLSVEQFRTLNGYDVTKLEEVAAMFKYGRIPKCPLGGAYLIEITSDGTVSVECPNCNNKNHNPQNSTKVGTPLKSENGSESLADDIVIETVTNEEGAIIEIQTSNAPSTTAPDTTSSNATTPNTTATNTTTPNTTVPNNGGISQGNAVSTLSKGDVVKLLNTFTANSGNKSYNWNRTCNYKQGGKVSLGSDSMKNILNSVINSISAGDDVDSVVGGFIGIGSKSGKVTNGRLTTSNGEAVDSKYCLKAMSLTESDVTSMSNSGNVYTLKLINCTNPQKDNSNSLHHATNDFITKGEVDKAIANYTTAVAVKNTSTITYSNIIIKATVSNGTLTNIEISYDFSAKLDLGVQITNTTGTCSATTKIAYSNFK